MGLIERWGSGTTRMAEELQIAGLPVPEFRSKMGRFQVIFYKPLTEQSPRDPSPDLIKNQKTAIQYVKDQGTISNAEYPDLTKNQRLAIQYVKDHETISNAEYQDLTGVSKRTASRELQELKLKGIFTAAGRGKRGRGIIYTLTMPIGP